MMALLIIALSLMKYANADKWSTGMATFYTSSTVLNDDGNACGMSGTASAYKNTMYAAIAGSEFDDGYGCGKCYKIKGTGAYGNNPDCNFDTTTITIQAIDQCPSSECSASHFDLSKDAMMAITGTKKMAETCGEISIKYKRVDCTDIEGNFYIKNKSGTSKWWYGFKLNDVNDDGGIKSVVLKSGSTQVATCSKSDGSSYWLCEDELTKGPPLSIQITSDKGKTVTATDCITSFSGNKVMQCNTNLSKGSSFTEEEEPSTHSQYWYTGVIAVVLLSCIICGVVGFFYVKRRKQKAKDAVSFIETDENKTTEAGDGDSEATGYDMNPIDTAGDDTVNGDTPNSQTPADTPVADDHDEEQEIEIEVEANDQVTLS